MYNILVQYWLSALLEYFIFYLVVLFDTGHVIVQLINKSVFYEPQMVVLCIKEDQFPCRFHIVFFMHCFSCKFTVLINRKLLGF